MIAVDKVTYDQGIGASDDARLATLTALKTGAKFGTVSLWKLTVPREVAVIVRIWCLHILSAISYLHIPYDMEPPYSFD